MLDKTRRLLRQVLLALVYGLLGSAAVALFVFVRFLDSRPDLDIWHTQELDAEFTTDSDAESFADYLALEEELFAQLRELVVSRVETGPHELLNRFSVGSLADPARWPGDWNRTRELHTPRPRAGVLLLHGMSDSPYSLRALAERLHEAGAHVIALRLPGHGTAPSGLVTAHWKDMAAAARLALVHLSDATGDAPLYVVGYSNGGALAVHYALAALEDPALPRLAGIVLVSPAIGVSGLAALAVWQARLGYWLGLDKLSWNSILPEYDPFKYSSFAVNAGDQVYRITEQIRVTLTRLEQAGQLGELPPILAFQSAVDATVSTPALLEVLLRRLPEGGHELYLFDLNRRLKVEFLLGSDPRDTLEALVLGPDREFAVSLLTNESARSDRVVLRRYAPDAETYVTKPLGYSWPRDVFSLSHVALPFRSDDPVYGAQLSETAPGIQLGALAFRGERGVLRISGSDQLRLRSNPFYDVLESRVLSFTGLDRRGD